MTQRQHDDEGRCDECDPFGDSSRCVCEPVCARRYVSDPDLAKVRDSDVAIQEDDGEVQ